MYEPHAHDVLCGRGKGSYMHRGNIVFHELVHLNKSLYLSSKKSEKLKISERIVNSIRSQDPPGRFLNFDSSVGAWNVIVKQRAIEKTKQALRERQAGASIKTSSRTSEKQMKDGSYSNYPPSRNKNSFSKIPILPELKKLDTIAPLNYPLDSTCQQPNNNKTDNAEIAYLATATRKKPSFNLSSYDDIILASLQKDYSNKRKLPLSFKNQDVLNGFIYDSVVNDNMNEIVASNKKSLLHYKGSSIAKTINSDHNCFLQDYDEFDDDILKAIMDLGQDSSSSKDLTTHGILQKSYTTAFLPYSPSYKTFDNKRHRLTTCLAESSRKKCVSSSAA